MLDHRQISRNPRKENRASQKARQSKFAEDIVPCSLVAVLSLINHAYSLFWTRPGSWTTCPIRTIILQHRPCVSAILSIGVWNTCCTLGEKKLGSLYGSQETPCPLTMSDWDAAYLNLNGCDNLLFDLTVNGHRALCLLGTADLPKKRWSKGGMIRRRDHGLQRESSSLFGLRLSIPLSLRAEKTTGEHQIERKRSFWTGATVHWPLDCSSK